MNSEIKKSERAKRTSRLFLECMRHFIAEVGATPVCGPKCPACCHRMPFIRSGMEEEFISIVLDGLDPNIQKEVVPKIPGNLKAWRDLCVEHGQNSRKILHPFDIQTDWVELFNPCPLLIDGLCAIYPRIPLDCRFTMKAGTICLTPSDCDFAAGMHEEVINLCHKIDRELKKKPYRDISLIEVLHLWATK